MPPHCISALASMGKAILVSQNLEKLLVEMLEFRKLHHDFEYAKRTGGAVGPELYKMALMNGVKRLRDENAIHPSLDSALVKYIEDRHILVHRWALSHGFPEEDNLEAWAALGDHSRSVGQQATNLLRFIGEYLAEYAMPEVAARDYATYQTRMLGMFNREYRP